MHAAHHSILVFRHLVEVSVSHTSTVQTRKQSLTSNSFHQWRSQVFESGRVHEKPDLPEAFHEHFTAKFGGSLRDLPPPQKKIILGLAEMQFPAVL